MANFFAQTEALAFGKTAAEVEAEGVAGLSVPHRTFPGNRPTNTLLPIELTPAASGQACGPLRAQGVRAGSHLGHQSFDQWGVELGKSLALRIVPELTTEAEPSLSHDSSTNGLIRRYRAARRHVTKN